MKKANLVKLELFALYCLSASALFFFGTYAFTRDYNLALLLTGAILALGMVTSAFLHLKTPNPAAEASASAFLAAGSAAFFNLCFLQSRFLYLALGLMTLFSAFSRASSYALETERSHQTAHSIIGIEFVAVWLMLRLPLLFLAAPVQR